jgi:hypothetical protein
VLLCVFVLYPLAYLCPGSDHGSFEHPANTLHPRVSLRAIGHACHSVPSAARGHPRPKPLLCTPGVGSGIRKPTMAACVRPRQRAPPQAASCHDLAASCHDLPPSPTICHHLPRASPGTCS